MDNCYGAWAARWRVALSFGLGVGYLVFSQPTVRLLVVGSAAAFLGLGLRAYAAGYVDKSRSLTTAGPYRYTRHPLYFGSFLLGLGFAIAGGSWALPAAFLLLFAFVYWPVMRREEESLRGQFKEAYVGFTQNVPFFFPWFRSRVASESPNEKFLWQRYRKNREYEAALGYVAGVIFLALKIRLR